MKKHGNIVGRTVALLSISTFLSASMASQNPNPPVPPQHYPYGTQPAFQPMPHAGESSSTAQTSDQNTMLLNMMMSLMRQIEQQSKMEGQCCCNCQNCSEHKDNHGQKHHKSESSTIVAHPKTSELQKPEQSKLVTHADTASKNQAAKNLPFLWVAYNDISRPKLTANMTTDQVTKALIAYLGPRRVAFNTKHKMTNAGKEAVYLIDNRTITKNLENSHMPQEITEFLKDNKPEKLTALLKTFFTETVTHIDWDDITSLGARLANVMNKAIQENLYLTHKNAGQTNILKMTVEQLNGIIKKAAQEALIAVDKKFQQDDEALLMGMPRFKVYIFTKGLMVKPRNWTEKETGAHIKQEILEKQGLPLLPGSQEAR